MQVGRHLLLALAAPGAGTVRVADYTVSVLSTIHRELRGASNSNSHATQASDFLCRRVLIRAYQGGSLPRTLAL